MTNFSSFLQRNIKKYPHSTTSDYLKLIYQSEFGPGHLIKSKSSSLNYLIEEIESIKVINDNNVLYEYISNDFIRVNLDIYKKYNLDLCKLNTLFQETSMLIHKNNLSKKLDILESCIGPSEDITAFRSTPVQMHHSEIYKKYYDPHYRLISSNLIDSNFKSLLLDDYLSNLSKKLPNNKIYFIALEGRCCSGKTTITKNIKNASVIHADDFFSNTSEPLDFNRLKNVLLNLEPNKINTYEIFNCMSKNINDAYSFKKTDILKKIVIVEGVYSYHEAIRDIYDEVIYINSSDNQLQRLLNRCNGNSDLYNKFINIWIPREELYFNSFDFIKNASIII